MEKPAAGQEGFLIRVLDEEDGTIEFYFRVYEGANGNFVDYRIDADDIEIQIMDENISLYNEPGFEPTLDYNSRVLGKNGNGNGKK